MAADYGMRWGIENMFSDLKSRGFGLMDSKIQRPGRPEKGDSKGEALPALPLQGGTALPPMSQHRRETSALMDCLEN